MQVHGLRNRETLRHQVAPNVVVIGLVQQGAIEIEADRVDLRPIRRVRGCGSHAARIIRTPEWTQAAKHWSISTRTATFPMACWRRARSWNGPGCAACRPWH